MDGEDSVKFDVNTGADTPPWSDAMRCMAVYSVKQGVEGLVADDSSVRLKSP